MAKGAGGYKVMKIIAGMIPFYPFEYLHDRPLMMMSSYPERRQRSWHNYLAKIFTKRLWITSLRRIWIISILKTALSFPFAMNQTSLI